MKKPAIPTPLPGSDKSLPALKENVEIITGRRGGKVADLAPTASSAEVIAKINELLARLQG